MKLAPAARPARRPPGTARASSTACKASLDDAPARRASTRAREQGVRACSSAASAEAFDLSKEDPRTVARYDTAPLVRPGEHRQEVEQLQQLRRQRQVARQAAAAGPAAVRARLRLRHRDDELRLGHARRREQRPGRRGHAATWARRSTTPCRRSSRTSRPAACATRSCWSCCGEMGRTPRINQNGGRDHWGNLGPLLLAGGGLEDGPGDRPVGPQRRRAGLRPGAHPEPDRHGPAHAVRRRQAPRHPRRAARGPADGRVGADPRAARRDTADHYALAG